MFVHCNDLETITSDSSFVDFSAIVGGIKHDPLIFMGCFYNIFHTNVEKVGDRH